LNERDQAQNAENFEAMRGVPVPGGSTGFVVAAVLMYGSNALGIAITAATGLLALAATTSFQLGFAGFLSVFGLLAVGLDLGLRTFVIRGRLFDPHAGGAFAFLPSWAFGLGAIAFAGVIALAPRLGPVW